MESLLKYSVSSQTLTLAKTAKANASTPVTSQEVQPTCLPLMTVTAPKDSFTIQTLIFVIGTVL